MTLIEKVKQQLYTAVSDAACLAAETLGQEAQVPTFNIEVPREKEHGDFSANAAMVLAKTLKKAPRMIAEEMMKHISLPFVDKVEVAGAGFINFYLNPSYLYEVLADVESQGSKYGAINIGDHKKVMIEFISANPTGPMHMGNARGGALGDSLSNILTWAGYDVTKEFYVNDAGNQIEKFGISLEARYLQELLGEDAVVFPEDGYQGEDIRVRAKEFIEINGDAYVNKPSEQRKQALVDFALPRNIEFMKKTLDDYRISYDVWFRESTLYKSGELENVIESLKKSGYTYEKEDAIWFKSTEFGSEKDDVLVRANGIPTYFAADIAYHANKFKTRHFDKVINIWGADHHGHVARMKGAMQAIGVDPDKLDIIIMQLVKLMSDGKPVKMSKRTGKAVSLDVLIEDIGIDAARYFFVLRQSGSHLDFDLDLAVKESNENPVFYVQYAHARICSILNILDKEGITVKPFSDIDVNTLKEEQELALLKQLADFPEEIRIAAETYEPSRLTHYASSLASAFHSFYNACRVKCEDEACRDARVKLIDATRMTIQNVLSILAVTAPDKM